MVVVHGMVVGMVVVNICCARSNITDTALFLSGANRWLRNKENKSAAEALAVRLVHALHQRNPASSAATAGTTFFPFSLWLPLSSV